MALGVLFRQSWVVLRIAEAGHTRMYPLVLENSYELHIIASQSTLISHLAVPVSGTRYSQEKTRDDIDMYYLNNLEHLGFVRFRTPKVTRTRLRLDALSLW